MGERGLHDLGEDATGFGRVELRTVWGMLARPAVVLDAYMTGGPTGHGEYTRPLRLYLALCGVMMVILFLIGGSGEVMLSDIPEEALAPLLEAAGKSRDAFFADADGWMSRSASESFARCSSCARARAGGTSRPWEAWARAWSWRWRS